MISDTKKLVSALVVAGMLLCGICPPVSAAGIIKDIKLDLGAGYRVDQLQWSIAGNNAGTNPNILSELTWDDLKVFQIQHRGYIEFGSDNGRKLTPQISWLVGYGTVFSGDNQDSDYGGDNRTLEWSRSNNAADDGSVFDLSGGFGLKLNIAEGFSLMPQLGYSLHQQNLRMTDGDQTLSNQAIVDAVYGPGVITLLPTGPFAGLDSSYETEGRGPWLGLRAQKKLGTGIVVHGGLEYHWVNFTADADWNLRSDLAHPVSFRHDGEGTGLVYELGVDIALGKGWTLNLQGNLQQWQVDPGRDTIFFSSGTRAQTRLQEVIWESYAVMAGVGYLF